MSVENKNWHYYFLMKKLDFLKIILIFVIFFFSESISFAIDNSVMFLSPVDIETLNPGKSSDLYSGEVLNNIFEGLVRAGRNPFEVEPGLAVKWKTSVKGKVWDFILRKGVKFHNGKEFDSSDVVYTFKNRMKNHDRYKYWNLYYSSLISDVKIVSKFSVRFILKRPYVPFLFQLATTSALIVSSLSDRKEQFLPIGTGPFKFERWEEGKFVSIIRNSDYWGRKAKLSKIVFKVVSDPAWKLLQIKNGNGDMSFVRSGKEYGEVKGRRNLKMASFPSTTIHYLGFNVKKKPFNNVYVRRAFAHLLNKELLIKNIFQNFAKNATTPIPSHIFGFNSRIKDYSFDIKKARSLIKKAGYPEGFKTKLFYSSSSQNLEEIASALVRAAKKIKVSIIKVPKLFSELRKSFDSGEHEMFMMGWLGTIPDPDVFLYPVFSNKQGNLNRSNYSNQLVTDLLESGRREINPVERKRIYFKIQEIIHKDVPWIPLYNLNYILVYNKSVSNVYVNQFSIIYFRDVYKEKN